MATIVAMAIEHVKTADAHRGIRFQPRRSLRPSRRCAHVAAIRDARPAVTARPTPPADRLLTADEVSRILRVQRSTVYELARNRRIPFLKVNRWTLFDQELLRQWIAQQTVRPRR
jgi:excisionase family DNA binding protein